ncbi:MAG: diguanylate cyclase [Pseudomonadota bacterium]
MTDQDIDQPPTEEQRDLLARALAGISNPVLITSADSKIVWVNAAFCALTGYTQTELLGQSPALLQSGEQDTGFYRQLWKTISRGSPWRGELVNRRRDGSLFTAEQTITPLFDEHGHITHFAAIQQDITDSKHEVDQNQYLAYHDSLTGLPNRTHFLQMVQAAIDGCADKDCVHALLFIDLDKFKPVNDTYGHPVGDALLVAVAQRLCAAMRKNDLVARIGGDEFVVLRTNLQNLVKADALAQALVKSLSRPFSIGTNLMTIGASVGIAFWPQDGSDAAALILAADKAMYRAKQSGGNSWARTGYA